MFVLSGLLDSRGKWFRLVSFTFPTRTNTQMILEFRIPLPLTVEDFQVAQLSMVIKAQEKVTGGGEGVVVVKNEPYAF